MTPEQTAASVMRERAICKINALRVLLCQNAYDRGRNNALDLAIKVLLALPIPAAAEPRSVAKAVAQVDEGMATLMALNAETMARECDRVGLPGMAAWWRSRPEAKPGPMPVDPRDEVLRVATEALNMVDRWKHGPRHTTAHETAIVEAIEDALGAIAKIGRGT